MASLSVLRTIYLCLAVLLGSTATASAEGRHALVVGIDTYENVPSLQKAVNDARAVKAALTTAGFEVQLVEGPDQIGFLEAIASFSARIGPGDEAVVYYAGHGVEIDGRNYLLPSDVPAAGAGQEIVLTNRSISVQDLVDALQARGARISLLILDACRDNPFPRSGTRSIGGTRGLAAAPKAEGTFILYSAGEGETALDRLSNGDANPNSVFTRALVPLIAEPGLPLREVSRRVRSDLRQMALSVDHAQFPAVYDQLDGDFSFTVAGVVTDPCIAARADWALIEQSNNKSALEDFQATYPKCPVLQALARGRLDAVNGFSSKSKNDAQTYVPIEFSADLLEIVQPPSGDLIHSLVVLSDSSLDEIIKKIEKSFELEHVVAPDRRKDLSVYEQFDELREEASSLRDSEEFSASIIPFLEALRFAEREFGPTSDAVSQVLNHFGGVFTGPGATENQVIRRDIFYLCAEMYFENEGEDSPNGYLNALNSTSALRSVGNWVKAKEIIKEALAFYGKSNQLSFDYAMALQHYADVIAHDRDALFAISLYQKALIIIGESRGLASRNYLDAKMNLAWLLHDAGACREAKSEIETVRMITSQDPSLVNYNYTETVEHFSGITCSP